MKGIGGKALKSITAPEKAWPEKAWPEKALSKKKGPEKAVTVPVSWMQDKENQNHPCVQLSNYNYMSRQVYKQKSVASGNIFQAIFKIPPLFVICSRKFQIAYKELTKT